jgi:hypothetical protein
MVFMTGLLRLPPTLHAAGLPPGVVPIGGGAVAVIEPVASVVLVVYHPELGEARIHPEQLAHYQGRGYSLEPLERPKPAAVATGITTPKPKPQPGPLPKPPRPTGR